MTIQIHRAGDFTADQQMERGSKCGSDGLKKYGYEVWIRATNNFLLPPSNFIIDNNAIDAFFKQRYEHSPIVCRSCEDMAQEAVEAFLGMFSAGGECEGVDVNLIRVKISGTSYSDLTAEWSK